MREVRAAVAVPFGRLCATLLGLGPKQLIILLITLILVVGEWRYGAIGGYPKLAVILGTCLATEIALSLFLLGRFPRLSSAYVTGTSLSILLRPRADLIWPLVAGALLAIGSKYVLRYRGRHLWNPSNFGISLLVLLAPNQVAILSHELGNDLLGNAVIWIVGLLVASRARVLHVTATYALCFSLLALLRSAIVGTPVLAEIAPLTGPMYQLLLFFMLTDPPTSPRSRRGRIATVAAVALLEAWMRVGSDLHWPLASLFAPAPPILALFLVGPIALAISLRRAQGGPGPVAAVR